MGIPKIIHYCWFGGKEKPRDIKKYMESWKILSDYKIIEWNENNFDINSHEFIKEAYRMKKYAFVSDYVRLNVLKKYGGIYLDTDIEVKKDFSPLLDCELFLGFMYDSLLGTAVIGSKKNNLVISNLLKKYDSMNVEMVANNNMYTKYFLDNFKDFKLNNKVQSLDGNIMIYPKEYFERPAFNKKIAFSEHHYTATWKDEGDKYIKKYIKNIIPNTIYRKITHKRALKYTPFYNIYLEHKNS
ncbi:glycosyltransferase family 32 protein [Clostridium perfringens]|uniref:glycosyltransferase family 32 protein n=1 Tax=Clostridium perfringens TaxID=1502 RepID=UPI002FCD1BFD